MVLRSFNPRTPSGVRQEYHEPRIQMVQFQSTHPERGATSKIGGSFTLIRFNPRTPSGVRLWQRGYSCTPIEGFNPRTPSGVRQYKKERAESQGNMWYVLRTYWYGFPLNKLSDFSFKLSS